MKPLNLTLLLSGLLLAGCLAIGADVEPPALGADTGSPPIGVQAANWIAVSEKLGFVVVANQGAPNEANLQPARSERGQLSLSSGPFATRVRSTTPPVPAAGYFMVKTSDGWRRLIVMTPAELAATEK